MLVGALADHESALRASLQAEYHLRLLDNGRTDPERTPLELADLIRHLPRGCALWVETGGDLAWTVEAHLQAEAVYLARMDLWATAGGKGQQPRRIEPPGPAHELAAKQEQMSKKAQAHAARAERRNTRG